MKMKVDEIKEEKGAMIFGPIYIVSGGTGSSGGQIVNTVLAQFPESTVSVVTLAHVRQAEQLEKVVNKAAASGGMIVHTLVDEFLRKAMTHLGEEKNVVTIDLMGSLLHSLSIMLRQKPLGQPGLYRKLHQAYFERVDAIEFTMSHDDGMRPHELPLADIVLVGVSRVGKTPLSMYLAVQGWKVANVPIVRGIAPPSELFEIDHRRVIGLSMEPEQLAFHRHRRQLELGVAGRSDYDDPETIDEEVEDARKFFRKNRFRVIGVTNKPIETSAAQIVKLLTGGLGATARKS